MLCILANRQFIHPRPGSPQSEYVCCLHGVYRRFFFPFGTKKNVFASTIWEHTDGDISLYIAYTRPIHSTAHIRISEYVYYLLKNGIKHKFPFCVICMCCVHVFNVIAFWHKIEKWLKQGDEIKIYVQWNGIHTGYNRVGKLIVIFFPYLFFCLYVP